MTSDEDASVSTKLPSKTVQDLVDGDGALGEAPLRIDGAPEALVADVAAPPAPAVSPVEVEDSRLFISDFIARYGTKLIMPVCGLTLQLRRVHNVYRPFVSLNLYIVSICWHGCLQMT